MKIILDIKNEKVIQNLMNFLTDNKDFIKVDLPEEKDLNEDLKLSLLEVLLIKKGFIKKKEISEFLNEL